MNTPDALLRLRDYLRNESYEATVVPTADPHSGEYLPSHYACRQWLSGFTGSAGTLAVTLQAAALWTDSRYFEQAEKELEGTGIELMRLKMPGTPTVAQWLRDQLADEDTVVLDAELYPHAEYVALEESMPAGAVVAVEGLFDQVWKDRPALEFHPIIALPESVTGESVRSKCERLRKRLDQGLPYVYLITACDEVAWLCNIRGTDIPYNPIPLSYAALTADRLLLFADPAAIGEEEHRHLIQEQVEIHPYTEFVHYLRSIPQRCVRIFSGNRICELHFQAALDNIPDRPMIPVVMGDPETGGTLARMKAVKNEVELAGFRKAFEEDAKAWKKLLDWIEQEIDGGQLTEYTVAQQLIAFRKESPDYRGESFAPIIAFGPHGAMPHYHCATPEEAAPITRGGFLLMDTGAHYWYGTTDTTRTIHTGEPTPEEKADYTAVLKGMLQLSAVRFLKGTRGASLDILARGEVFKRGHAYLHGTSHGIGHYLCVHEGPQSIRMEENPVALEPGNVLSNEPAIYLTGRYGIRLENVLAVEEDLVQEENTFYRFETLTQVPFDRKCIDFDQLGAECTELFNTLSANCPRN